MSTFNAACAPAFKKAWTPVWGAVQNLANQIKALFAAGQQGAWYDPSNMSTLYQDSAGTTPVTAMEQPVGLMLDKSFGLVRRPELVTNGTFDTNVNGWMPQPGGTITWNSGTAVCLSGGNDNILLSQSFPVVIGKYYLLSYDKLSNEFLAIYTDSGNSAFVTATGRQQFILKAAASTITFSIAGQGAFSTCTVDNLSCKLLDGNHAVQPTAINRPVLSARINLLTKSEQFTDGIWLKQAGTSVVDSAVLAADGTMTGASVSWAAAANGNGIYQLAYAISGLNTKSIYVRADVAGGTVKLVDSAETSGATVVTLSTAWQRVALTETQSGNAGLWLQKQADSPATVYISNPQLEVGPLATRYQRVNTAADYDTVGFPKYLTFDGIQSSLSSATGGGGSAGFFFCAAIRSQVSSIEQVTIIGDENRSAVALGYVVAISNGNLLRFYAGDGFVFTSVSAPGIVVGALLLVTAYDDGVNMVVQVNFQPPAVTLRPIVAAGKAGISIGKAADGNYEHLPGSIYESVYVRNSGLTPAQRLQIQQQIAAVAGITL